MGTIKVQEGKVGEVEQQPNRELEKMDVKTQATVHLVSNAELYLEAWTEDGQEKIRAVKLEEWCGGEDRGKAKEQS